MNEFEFIAYEYGVMCTYAPGLHRGPFSKEEAEDWVQSWKEDTAYGSPDEVKNLFFVVRRPVGLWEQVSTS